MSLLSTTYSRHSRQAERTEEKTDSFQTGRPAWAQRGEDRTGCGLRRAYLVTLLQMLVAQEIILVIFSCPGHVLVLLASQKLHGAWNGVKMQPKKVRSMNMHE